MTMNQTQKIIIGVMVVVLAGGGLYLWQKNKSIEIGTYIIEKEVEDTTRSSVGKTEWATFTFQEKGISFQYPKDWTVIDLPDPKAGVALRSPQYKTISSGNIDFSGEIYVNTIANPQNISVEDLFDTFSDTARFWFDKYEYQDIIYDGLSGVKFPKFKENNESYFRTEIFLVCGNKIVSISYFYEEEKYQDILENIANSLSCDSN